MSHEALRTPEQNLQIALDALERIRERYGRVCRLFEICRHPECNSSYGAWAAADEALRVIKGTSDEGTEV